MQCNIRKYRNINHQKYPYPYNLFIDIFGLPDPYDEYRFDCQICFILQNELNKFLTESEIRRLHKRYHDGLSYNDIGNDEGSVSAEAIRFSINGALQKLRCRSFRDYIGYNIAYSSQRLTGTATRLNPYTKMLYDSHSDNTNNINQAIDKIIQHTVDDIKYMDMCGKKQIKMSQYLSIIENIDK